MSMLFLLIKKRIRRKINTWKVRNKQKVFCIGRNKTGTTSLKQAFIDLGYIVGEQDIAEHLFDDYFLTGNYQPIINYCKTAQVFQDMPFSFYQTLPHIDKAFPNSKFILTVRDSPDQWYTSFVKYYSKSVGVNGRPAKYEELESSNYVSSNYRTKFIVDAHGTSAEDPFNRNILIKEYSKHIDYVESHFKGREKSLLTLNIAEPSAFQRFLDFIGQKSNAIEFPWENKT